MAKQKKEVLNPDEVIKSRFIVREHDSGEPISAWSSFVDAEWTMGVYVRMYVVNNLHIRGFYDVYDSKFGKVVAVSE